MTDNNHNDPLEQFFRKKVKEYDIEYKEEDWLNLEERLDNLDEKKSTFSWRPLAAAVVLILISVLSFITYQQQQKINQLNKRLSDSENTTNVPNLVQSIPSDKTIKPSDGNKNQQPTPKRNGNDLAAIPEAPAAETKQTALEQEEPLAKNSIEEDQQNIPRANIIDKNLVTLAQVSSGGDGRYPAISAIAPPKFNDQSVGKEHSQTPIASNISDNTVALRRSAKFTVGMLAGPDMSTVGGISDFYDPGNKLGVLLEYHINQNFAVSVGALRSKVRYTASGNEYNPPQGYWTYNTIPDHTIGECILIDIPISLKYNFLHFSKSRIYATAGVSSYIMLDEEYRFNYEYNRPGLKQQWQQRTGTRHWMSNATLSIGYEWM